MAKFKLSAIGITAIRGTIGGQTFSSNKGGIYVKNWAKPSNPMTPAQTALRNMFGSVVRSWKLLTESQRNDWNAYAQGRTTTDILGESRPMTGRGAFISVNQNRLHIGLPLAESVPAVTQLLSFSFLGDSGVGSKLKVSVPDYESPLAGTNIISVRVMLPSIGSDSYKAAKTGVTVRFNVASGELTLDISDALDQLGVAEDDKFLVHAHMHNTEGLKSNVVTGKFVRQPSIP